MQLRRVLLLFALVLGLSAVVASLAPPPATRDTADDETTLPEPAAPGPERVQASEARLHVPARRGRVPTRVLAAGARVSLEVSVADPGDVAVARLGLLQTANPLNPARFDFLAPPEGRYAVVFRPLRGRERVVARLEFRAGAELRPRRPRR